jgi:hypothetical protein
MALSRLEQQPDEFGAQPVRVGSPKAKKALSRIDRALNPEEIHQSGVQKMIVQDLERIEDENKELRRFRDDYYGVAQRVAVLEAKRKHAIGWEVLSTGCIALGSVATGFASALWSSQPTGWQVLIIGALILLSGIIARWFSL